MWLKRKTLKVKQLVPGMFINVGFQLYKIRSIDDGGVFRELNLMRMGAQETTLAYLTMGIDEDVHVNIKR